MTTPLARRERHELCDLALTVGEDAPTLCGDWTVKDLVAHLLVRENRPWAAAGIVVPPLSGWTERSMERMARKDFGVLVEKLRDPGLTMYRLPPAEVALNTLEYFVHHEDIRRAKSGWKPRDLDPDDVDLIWKLGRGSGRLMARRVGGPFRIRRTDTGAEATLSSGDDPVTVSGPPGEVVLFLFGRDQIRDIDIEGPPESVARLREADLGF
ncbi:MAG: TIGR03085 family metal-binding protein [Nocardioides sp.]